MKKVKFFVKYSIIGIFLIALSVAVKNTKDNIDNKSIQINFLEKNLNNKKNQLKNIHQKLLSKGINLENLIFEDGINFKKKQITKVLIQNNHYNLNEFKSDDIIFAKHPAASSSAYLEYYDNKILLVSATGQITFTDFENFKKNKVMFNIINSNIQEIIQYSEFFNSSAFGIKDILVNKNNIYVSYIKKHYEDCYSTSILHGKINLDFIFFKELYSPENCVNSADEFYNTSHHDKMVVHQSGGRLIFAKNKLIFSTGEFRYRTLAQDINSDFGKVISLDLSNNLKKTISLGHRNPQGLYYSEKLNKIFSTEHGPSGGDEINTVKLNLESTENLPNFGWPISSYGRHYFDNNDDDDPRYKLSPLHKSHSKYGYVEPIKYFDPSVGISQIIAIPNKFFTSNDNNFLVGTMGTAKKFKEGMLSLYFFNYDNDKNKINFSEIIPIKSRVRDMIYINEHNVILMYLENNNSIGILKRADK